MPMAIRPDDEKIGKFTEGSDLKFELPWLPFVVRIEERDQIAAGGSYSGVARCADALIVLIDVFDLGTLAAQNLSCVVGGAIVNDHDLLCRPSLERARFARHAGRYQHGCMWE